MMHDIARLFIFLFIVTSCHVHSDEFGERYPLIPLPVSLVPDHHSFAIVDELTIIVQPQNVEMEELASYVSDFIHASWGVQTKIVFDSCDEKEGSLNIIVDEESVLGREEYDLLIATHSITIKANHPMGAFWGFQTLSQLVPTKLKETSQHNSNGLTIPCVTIHDFPSFEYRGLHLDVARHMFPIDFIKKYLDLMASYKLNKFHWHLTDDQGWRIEIKSYPKLQDIAAFRDETPIGRYRNWLNRLGLGCLNTLDGTRYGGYYTQEEVKEIVEYARKRHITIIPEIELPGHSLAVLAAYPELGCRGDNYQTATHWGIFDDIYCAGSEKTFEFLENVLTEIIELFPSEFIHIGGDEARKTRWKECSQCQKRMKSEGLVNEKELQSYFIARIGKFLNSKKRQIIGWDEILEGGLAPNAVVMSWRGIEGGMEAARLGHYTIMTPLDDLYFNYYQSRNQVEPLAIGKYLPLQKVYQYNPIPDLLNPEQAKYILGSQANVWTEYLKTPSDVESMVFPRALALAEIVWTPSSKRNYADFILRLESHLPVLDAKGVNYSNQAIGE